LIIFAKEKDIYKDTNNNKSNKVIAITTPIEEMQD
jgi:hypothetical protein